MAKAAKKKPPKKPEARPKAKAAAAGSVRLSFGQRFSAWWHGYDAAALIQRELAEASAAHAPPDTGAQDAPPLDAPHDRWSADRIDIAELLWGSDFTGPGDADFIVNQCKMLALTPEMSMADLAAGLGGPMRALVEHFGTWMSGFETSPTLIDRGNELSEMAGMAKKAPLKLLDMTVQEPFERRYDRAFGRVFFSKWANLALPVKKLSEALKPEGMVLFNDYFLASDAVREDPDYISYCAMEPNPLRFHTVREVLAHLKTNSLDVRVNESITDSMSAMITEAWKRAPEHVRTLMDDEERRHRVPVLLTEAEIWTRRMRLMSDGKLEMRRIMAIKSGK